MQLGWRVAQIAQMVIRGRLTEQPYDQFFTLNGRQATHTTIPAVRAVCSVG